MLKDMQHHYTKGFLYSVIKFEWFSYTQLLAHYSATNGSIFRTCGPIHSQYSEWNKLNPTRYLQYLFEELPNLPVLTADHLDDYLPWAKAVQEKCK